MMDTPTPQPERLNGPALAGWLLALAVLVAAAGHATGSAWVEFAGTFVAAVLVGCLVNYRPRR